MLEKKFYSRLTFNCGQEKQGKALKALKDITLAAKFDFNLFTENLGLFINGEAMTIQPSNQGQITLNDIGNFQQNLQKPIEDRTILEMYSSVPCPQQHLDAILDEQTYTELEATLANRRLVSTQYDQNKRYQTSQFPPRFSFF